MVAPTAYDVTTLVNDVDVTDFVPFSSMTIQSYPRQVSTFRFRVENPTGVTPARDHSVKVTWDSGADAIVFLGFITQVRTVKQDNGIIVNYECEASDYKILLARSVMDVAELSGTDVDILGDLLTNGYPDLSSYFDFSSGVTGFADGIVLPTGNQSILDALNGLSDLTGGEWSFTDVAVGNDIVTFSGTDDIAITATSTTQPYLRYDVAAGGGKGTLSPLETVPATGGNPDNCLVWQATSGASVAGFGLQVQSFLYSTNNAATMNNVKFDYYINSDMTSVFSEIRVIIKEPGGSSFTNHYENITYDTWSSIDALNDTKTQDEITFPASVGETSSFSEVTILIFFDGVIDASTSTFDVRLDNIEFVQTPTIGGGGGDALSELNWSDTAPTADFNFNIDTSDEFGFDFDYTEGDFDDFNSVTVVGGNEEVAIDWTYPNQDSQVHIDLETDIKDLAVFKNTGSEGTPTWTSQTVGEFGKDTLGTVDVNYDPLNHWLNFNTAPNNYYDAVRVTGKILRPIRVRVEDVGAGEQTYATVIQNENITSVSQALALGDSKLNKRNAVTNLSFKTFEPGLNAGESINVTDTDRGLNQTLVIQSIRTRWLSPKLAEFEVECGSDEAVGVDVIIANNDKRSRVNQIAAGSTITTYEGLTTDSNVLTTGGQTLYTAT